MTSEEIIALPEKSIGGDVRIITDPVTGITSYEREPARFLLSKIDIFCYNLPDGTQWQVLEDIDGHKFRVRL